ncbi:MAG: glycosyltransferase family 1 protein, partial [Thermodesulfovibrionia bacterium]|nr:glycosyltransferase family 1 protein [Thermodesulfovibrionia bacterium]
SSNICISDNPWTFHERNFEILASGGFPLIRYVEIPNAAETSEITADFNENKEIVLFYTKDDLLNKIQYYLDNPEERLMIAECGRSVLINKFSHIAIAGKTMEFIKEYYRE